MVTEIEKKALALVNEVSSREWTAFTHADPWTLGQALCRAIEQHEAFRQEVSDELSRLFDDCEEHIPFASKPKLRSFIIAKPDPLDLVADDMMLGAYNPRREWGAELRAAIEKRGGKIVWGEG